MNSSASRAGSDASILATIIDGRAWVASSIRNPHFRKYCRLLNKTFHRPNPLAELLRPASSRLFTAVAASSPLLSVAHGLSHRIVPALVRVAAYAAGWRRQPEQWKPPVDLQAEEYFQNLLRHLFAEWPVPAFFDSVWYLPGNLIRRERHWYLHVAKGGSLRTAEDMPAAITRKAIHHAMIAPSRLGFHQALRWGQLKALGAADELIAAVLASPISSGFGHEEIRHRLLGKLSADPSFDPRDFGVIADVILELLAHGHLNRAKLLIDQPLRALRRHCYRRWQDLLGFAESQRIRFRNRDLTSPGLRAELRHIAHAVWRPMADVQPFEIKRSIAREAPSRWTIVERRSHAQLAFDGRILRHCVGSYWRRCAAERSSIFALRQHLWVENTERSFPRITIEVNRATRRIVQARGRWNRSLAPFERRIIAEWAGRNRLEMAV
jgi:hypothetical protein